MLWEGAGRCVNCRRGYLSGITHESSGPSSLTWDRGTPLTRQGRGLQGVGGTKVTKTGLRTGRRYENMLEGPEGIKWTIWGRTYIYRPGSSCVVEPGGARGPAV